MNSSQKLGVFLLILISVVYVYLAFFGKDFKLPDFKGSKQTTSEITNTDMPSSEANTPDEDKIQKKNVKIYILDKSGKLRSVYRECNPASGSCFEFAIKQLLASPTKWEKSHGFTSEIPSGTKLLSVRESSNSIMIDLSSDFETGGGAESTYMRVRQLIKTANSNTSTPVYLYINGKQANVIGGEGVMLKQPLNNKSLDE